MPMPCASNIETAVFLFFFFQVRSFKKKNIKTLTQHFSVIYEVRSYNQYIININIEYVIYILFEIEVIQLKSYNC